MPSFKSIATGLVALLAADAVIAGPCRPSLTTTSVSASSSSAASSSASTDTETFSVSTGTTSSVTEETSTSAESSQSETSTVSSVETASTGTTSATETTSTMETATSTEISSSASSTESSTMTTTSAEETSTTSAIESTTTSEAPATLPTIANPGFDDNTVGTPWVRAGPASVSNGAVFWKRSNPNVMVMRPGTSIAQEITDLRPNLAYRIRFYWVKFDTPWATAGCRLAATFGGEDLGEVATLPPRTPDNVFEEYVSTVYRPSTTSAELKISITCTAIGQQNRYYVEDVSIEFAE
ncbi:hypothetical protein CEP54_007899 [Fusarium duplospermum]|uniref:CBM-cenC domain-containing protein n=1 Tax=Fusarium duplospermum TaxID=1325734 RepID=A0A428PYT3_9HYPO|nr:hypothetical protein CEP54_007899 [Fusarium duplospermum]